MHAGGMHTVLYYHTVTIKVYTSYSTAWVCCNYYVRCTLISILYGFTYLQIHACCLATSNIYCIVYIPIRNCSTVCKQGIDVYTFKGTVILRTILLHYVHIYIYVSICTCHSPVHVKLQHEMVCCQHCSENVGLLHTLSIGQHGLYGHTL